VAREKLEKIKDRLKQKRGGDHGQDGITESKKEDTKKDTKKSEKGIIKEDKDTGNVGDSQKEIMQDNRKN